MDDKYFPGRKKKLIFLQSKSQRKNTFMFFLNLQVLGHRVTIEV